ncbi:MAG: imidazolonepropionase [Halofilum sp. (in: g-proteobacteria)]|nr:imidazolonepropionase [Halofilum sp. (in: g-proteobacteria)]
MTWDRIWTDCRIATLAGDEPYGAIEDGALAAADGRIAWIGRRADLPGNAADQAESLGGRWVTPGLVDFHTHLVFGGDRAGEFEMRLEGASYEAIARAGGGILSTVRDTRAAGEEQLLADAAKRLRGLLAEGVTTVEIKSGYGLDQENELKMLRVARRLGETEPVTVRTTCLAAHAIPPEYEGRADDYIDLVCDEILPAAVDAGLADAADAFCERIAFTVQQTERVFRAAQSLGLPLRLHAEQLSDQGGSGLAARYGALSADHLEYLSANDVRAMAEAGTVAGLLPGAFYTLRETQLPPIDALREHGVPMALGTDANPGSSPALSLLLMLNMGCTLFRLTPEEALRGVTINGARALGLGDEIGTLEVGKRADFAVWDIDQPAELAYWLGGNPCSGVVRAGKWVES